MIPSILEPCTPCSSSCFRTPFFTSSLAGPMFAIRPAVAGERFSQSFRAPKSKSNLRPDGCSMRKLYEGIDSSSYPLMGGSKKRFVGSPDIHEVVSITARTYYLSGCGVIMRSEIA